MKKIILIVSLLTLAAFVSVALAQQKPAPAPTPAPATAPAPAPAPAAPAKEEKAKIEKFTGVVEKIDELTKAIVVKGAKGDKTFAIDDKTKFTKGGKDMPFAELKKGMNVSVEFSKVGEKLVAGTIEASAPKAVQKK